MLHAHYQSSGLQILQKTNSLGGWDHLQCGPELVTAGHVLHNDYI